MINNITMALEKDDRMIIKGATLWTPDGEMRGDLALGGGLILAAGDLSSQDFSGFEIYDATGCLVFPGAIDPHVHFALPTPAGNSCDDFLSGSRAALAGGTTTVFDFVTPRRGESLKEALASRQAETLASLIPCHLHLGISEWNSRIAGELEMLVKSGEVKSVKAYLAYRDTIGISNEQLSELMRVLSGTGVVLMVHCEDGELIASRMEQHAKQGRLRPCDHPLVRPPEAEISAIGKVIGFAGQTGCVTYIVHISTGRGAEMVGQAKRSGIRIFGETCPQYLLLDESVYRPDKPDSEVLPFILSPPLRTTGDQERLWEALVSGDLDVVATDHCPFHLKGQKDRGLHDLRLVPNGAGGVEHRPALLYTYGVLKGRISPSRFVQLISTNPASIFGLGQRKGKLLPGFDADLVIWDPSHVSTISVTTHYSLCDSDIYEGLQVTGRVVETLHATSLRR